MNAFRQQWETARALARMFPRFCHEEPVELVALVLIIALAALGDIFHFAHGTTCFCLGGEIVIVVWRLAMLRSKDDREDFRKALDRTYTLTDGSKLARCPRCHVAGGLSMALCPEKDCPMYGRGGA